MAINSNAGLNIQDWWQSHDGSDISNTPINSNGPNWGAITASSASTGKTQQVLDHAIQGIMSYTTLTLDDNEIARRWPNYTGENLKDKIKMEMMIMLAKELMHNKQIEFTSQPDMEFNQTHYRARVYAVPNGQVKILRELKQI